MRWLLKEVLHLAEGYNRLLKAKGKNSNTKSEKEFRLISKNREALDKRAEIIAMQNVDI